MTGWTATGGGGRGRGLRGLLAAWIDVTLRPRRFFRDAVVPGDQAPGLLFAMLVVLVEESTRLVLTPAAVPALVESRVVSALITVAVAVLIVTPVALHLLAALATVGLAVLANDRSGISETVQVAAYAGAPCALAGAPVPAVRLAVTAYGTYLLVVGLGTVHRTSPRRAAVVAALPAAIAFGYGFRGFAALTAILSRWYLI